MNPNDIVARKQSDSEDAVRAAMRNATELISKEQDMQDLAVQTAMLDLVVAWFKSSRFIFVGGVARSGTTLMKSILDSHPNICCGHELKLVPLFCSVPRKWWTDMKHQLIPGGMTPEYMDQTFAAATAVYMMRCRTDGKKRIAEKTPHNVTEFAVLHRYFPNAQFVHIVRDGRGVAASLLQQNWVDLTNLQGGKVWYTQNAGNAGRYWRHIIENADKQRADIPDSQYKVVRYEDLVKQPEATLRDLFEFLGEPWHPEVLTVNPVHAASLNIWRTKLSQQQLSEFDAVAGELMKKLGYMA